MNENEYSVPPVENSHPVNSEANSTETERIKKRTYIKGLLTGAGVAIVIMFVTFALLSLLVSGINRRKYGKNRIVDSDVADKIEGLEAILEQYYYEDVDPEDVENGLYYGVMASVGDPYTCYYTPEEMAEMSESLAGTYKGVGLYLSAGTDGGYPTASGTIEGSPASETDIEEGDWLIKVDGEDVYGQSLDEIVAKVRGPEGTTVVLTLKNTRRGEYDVTLERKELETETVKYELLEDNIAFVTITEFDDVTKKQFTDTMTKVRADNPSAMILDLRGNPGGNVDAVVEVANELLPAGIVVYTEDKYGNRKDYECKGEHEIDIPMVVLIDGATASSAEILSGAIKDYEKGVLMGTTTYGKGVVQTVLPLKDGSAVKVTISKYYTPKGVNIHKVGIEPDVEVKFDAEKYLEDKTDNQKEEAIKYLKEHK